MEGAAAGAIKIAIYQRLSMNGRLYAGIETSISLRRAPNRMAAYSWAASPGIF
jgi:hypothetical protein